MGGGYNGQWFQHASPHVTSRDFSPVFSTFFASGDGVEDGFVGVYNYQWFQHASSHVSPRGEIPHFTALAKVMHMPPRQPSPPPPAMSDLSDNVQ